MSARYLSNTQIRGLLKLGELMAPGDKALPSFSQAQVYQHVDAILGALPRKDREGLALLMGLFAWTPRVVLRILLAIINRDKYFPDPIGVAFRLLSIGLKGLVYSLYYSDLDRRVESRPSVMNVIGWSAKIKSHLGGNMLDRTSTKNLKAPSENDIKLIFDDAELAKREVRSIELDRRIEMVGRLKKIILQQSESIIDQVQSQTNKSRTDAIASDIIGALDYLSFLEKEARKALRDQKVKTPLMLMGKKSKIMFDPVGTLLIISPWNYPFYQAIVPIATSFVCGNATIYKPSEFTPLTGLIEELLFKAGFDEKWVQVVYGDGSVGGQLIEHRPDKIFFTGSVSTGKKVMAKAAEQIIPVELELGGKDPAVVFSDANIQRAAAGILWGGMTTLGQSCTSVERVYVQDEVYEQFKTQMVKLAGSLIQKLNDKGDADVGGITTQGQKQKIYQFVEDAKHKGATFLTGGDWDGESDLIPCMIVEGAKPDMLISKEETFGPIIPLFRFEREEDALRMANDSVYGLSASVWTGDKKRAIRVTRQLEVGNVSVNNVMLTEGNSYLPFGGRKLSGIGSYKGICGIRAFCHQKSVLIDANSSKIEANWYPYTEKKYNLFVSFIKSVFSQGPVNFIKFVLTGLKLESYANAVGKKGRE